MLTYSIINGIIKVIRQKKVGINYVEAMGLLGLIGTILNFFCKAINRAWRKVLLLALSVNTDIRGILYCR